MNEALERRLLPSLKSRLEGQGVVKIDLDGFYLEHYVAYPEVSRILKCSCSKFIFRKSGVYIYVCACINADAVRFGDA